MDGWTCLHACKTRVYQPDHAARECNRVIILDGETTGCSGCGVSGSLARLM